MRWSVATWLCATLVGSLASCTPELTNGAYTCVSNETCPDGWRCLDGRCYSAATGSCTSAEECDDGKPCTEERCESGSCRFEATMAGEGCNNGVFCDGEDTCDGAGVCAPSGVPPCPGCDAAGPGTGCMGCGQIGQPCCMDTCVEGVCDPMTTRCVDCGCASDMCPSGFACNPTEVCVSGVCQECGDMGEPCCNGTPRCSGVLTCTLGTCALPDAPCGGLSEPCCGSSPRCDMGLGCTDPAGAGVCQPCGEMNQPCCEGDVQCTGGGLSCCPAALGGTEACSSGPANTCQPCGTVTDLCCVSSMAIPCTIGSCIEDICQMI